MFYRAEIFHDLKLCLGYKNLCFGKLTNNWQAFYFHADNKVQISDYHHCFAKLLVSANLINNVHIKQ